MDPQKIRSLIELMNSSDLSELTYREGEVSLTLNRASQDSSNTRVSPNARPNSDVSSESADHENKTPAPDAPGIDVESPLYGIVYLSPSEHEKPYVAVGDPVTEGQTLCLLETMKMFHPVTAEATGTVRKIYVSSGEEVESGQPLFLID